MLKAFAAARWALVAVLVLVLAAPALAVSLGGRLIVEVDGASMNPTYQIGDVIVVREPTEADLVVGRVVTAIDGNGDYYTHRIETVNDDGSLGLKGDGNAASDPGSVTLEQLRGVVELHFAQPWAGLIIQLQQWPLRICLLAVILGLALLPLSGRTTEPAPQAVDDRPSPVRRARRSRALQRFSRRRGLRRSAPGLRRTAEPGAAAPTAEVTPEIPVEALAPVTAALEGLPLPSGALGYAISVVDGPDGQPRVRVSVDMDPLALSAALAVAAPSRPTPVAPGAGRASGSAPAVRGAAPVAVAVLDSDGFDPIDADEHLAPQFPSRSMTSVHLTAGAQPVIGYGRVRGRRSRHGRRRAF